MKKAIIYLIFTVGGFFIYEYLVVENKTQLNGIIQNPEKHADLLISGIPVLIGLVVVLSIFYLGKFHDYKRDYIKETAKFNEQQMRMEIILGKMKNYKLSKEDREELKKYFDEDIIDSDSLTKQLLKDKADNIKDIKVIEKSFQEFPKSVTMFLGFTILILSMILILVNIFNVQEESYLLLTLVGGIVLGICIFAIMWWGYEETIDLYDIGLRSILEDTSILKTSIDNLRESFNRNQNS